MRIGLIGLLLVSTGCCSTVASPPIEAHVEANWPAPPLAVQYLEALTLEDTSSLWPMLHFLAFQRNLNAFKDKTIAALSAQAQVILGESRHDPETIPLFNSELPHRDFHEAFDTIMWRVLGQRGARFNQSMHMSIAARETSVLIEGMRQFELNRLEEIGGSRSSSNESEVTTEPTRVCGNWVDVGDARLCDEEQFWEYFGAEQRRGRVALQRPNLSSPRPRLLPFDHIFPEAASEELPAVILYADLEQSASFGAWFRFLWSLTASDRPARAGSAAKPRNLHPPARPFQPRLRFAIRWGGSSSSSTRRLVLSGYGAALDIKKSEYLAIDDRNSAATDMSNLPSNDSAQARSAMLPVKKQDVSTLALRTTAAILKAGDPFEAFVQITSAFPLRAAHLPREVPEIPDELEAEMYHFQTTSPLSTRPGFYINGIALQETSVEPFALLRVLRKERRYVSDLMSLSYQMKGQEARSILMDQGLTAAATGGANARGRQAKVTPDVLGDLFDAGDREEGGGLILWWNDLEKDKKYKTWSKDIKDLLRPAYPGSMNLVRRNLHNVVFVLDLSQPSALAVISDSVRGFIARAIPIRFGLVPVVSMEHESNDVSALVAKVLWHLVERYGRASAMQFCSSLALQPHRLTVELLRESYTRHMAQLQDSTPAEEVQTFDALLAADRTSTLGKSRLGKARKYIDRLALPPQAGSTGSFFLDGSLLPMNEEWMQDLQRGLSLHVQYLQQMIYTDEIKNSDDVNRYFFDLPTTHKRRHPLVFPSETNEIKIVNLIDATRLLQPQFARAMFIEGVTPEQLKDADLEAPPVPVSIYVLADLDSPDGRKLATSALKFVHRETSARVALIHSQTSPEEKPHAWSLSNLMFQLHSIASISELLPTELIAWLELEIDADGPKDKSYLAWAEEDPIKPFVKQGVDTNTSDKAREFWRQSQMFASALGLLPGQNGVVINGRVLGPLESTSFDESAFRSLYDYELRKRIRPALDAIQAANLTLDKLDRRQQSNLYNMASSILSHAYQVDPAAGSFGGQFVGRLSEVASLHLNSSGSNINALIEIVVVVDPATELAQKWAPIVRTLASYKPVHLKVVLNPISRLKEIPIKRFYQYSFAPSIAFSQDGSELTARVAFEDVPEDTLFTFATDMQQSWLAFPRNSVHDLDNIRLADIPQASRAQGIRAVFELENLVIEGHAREMPSSQPPRGLQLELLSSSSSGQSAKRGDTIVMANLGYFQLKANPGPWRLGIRSGRSSEIYSFESIGANGINSEELAKTGDLMFLSTLEGLTLYPRLRRNPGKELDELLDDNDSQTRSQAGLFGRIKSLYALRIFIAMFSADFTFRLPLLRKTSIVPTGAPKADINVFTVASGLLYERMAFLMMVSVMRHTKSTVKFWFIQNFLSPSFRAFIPHMAREYGFDYELVTYKWPHWLRSQKEKQRTIWGYKILFLDVLFPLELDRVIFVDSDQIVRTDLKELIDMDIKGAPYAYAPMGDDRPEMEGFRFWKTGYWKDHLRDSPYHISALYLVDLDRFRRMAAGDRLRGQYQALSADPNSLANLDQDLPNNMQSVLPIHTLDRSWLWCETWCSDESLAQAKTIDLCNNPLTHEPKLHRAKRLIPEWTVYDDEVAALAKRVADAQSDIGAFGSRADELEQAVQQSVERDEFVGAASTDHDSVDPSPAPVDHPKDEL